MCLRRRRCVERAGVAVSGEAEGVIDVHNRRRKPIALIRLISAKDEEMPEPSQMVLTTRSKEQHRYSERELVQFTVS